MNHAGHTLGILASSALHALVFVSLPNLSSNGEPHTAHTMDFELQLQPPIAPPEVPTTPAPEFPKQGRPAAAAVRAPTSVRPVQATTRRMVNIAPDPEPSAPAADAPENPASPVRTPSAPVRATVDLSALAVARAMVDVQLPPETPPRPTTTLDLPAERRLEMQLAADVPELARTSEGGAINAINHGAMDAVAFAERPWAPLLQPLRRGRYHYRGKSFDAVVLANGEIQYRQREGVSLSIMQGVISGGAPGGAVPALAFHSLIAKLTGDSPAVGERKRFLERTRPLREFLLERARRYHMAVSDGRTEQRLRRLLAAHSDREPKHDAVFAVWTECSDDELGELSRLRIEAFLREQCPPDSDCAFRPQDLARLNQNRGQRRAFDPYAAPIEADGVAREHKMDAADPVYPGDLTTLAVPPSSPPDGGPLGADIVEARGFAGEPNVGSVAAEAGKVRDPSAADTRL